MSLAIGVDIGGTKIAAGLVSATGEIVNSCIEPTPDDVAGIPGVVAGLVQRLRGDESVVAIGVGAAGFVDADRATVIFAPNIDWEDEPLAANIHALVDIPVTVENDANAAAWGEFRFGAGKDTDDLLFVTMGTGVGGGIVHGGQLFRGGFGIAAEIGHMRVMPDGILCGCGQLGCLEQYASGSALVRDARERVDAGAPGSAALAALHASGDEGITGPAITALAEDGDPLARELLAGVGQWMGEGIAILAAILDPQVVAIGGGVAEAGDLLLESVVEAFEHHLPGGAHRHCADVRLAVLGNEAGIIGAADLARIEQI